MKNKILKNASWIIVCKIIQSLISLVIGMISARYLGPSNYGIINYAASVVAFVLPIMQLGLNQTLVRELIATPDKEGDILGTSLTINIISSVVCILGTIAFVSIANAGETETIIVCILYSFSLLFQATDMIQYWFQAKLLSKFPSIATLSAYTVVALYKVFLLVTHKSVEWFAVSNVIDYLLISIILVIAYKKLGGDRFSFNFKLGKEMLSRSKYYIIPSLMVMIFQNTDKIMLKLMIGEKATGFYSAAITCIGISGFVFAAIIDSARPVILEEKGRNIEVYENRVIQLYSIITCLSFLQSIAMTVLAKPLVLFLYGKDYVQTISILRVAVWYVTFSYYGSVRNIWILAENKQKYLLKINIWGALANVFLNWLLIPVMGVLGAAVASLITQFFTNVIIGFVIKPIKYNNYLMIKGLNPKVLTRTVKVVAIQLLKK